MTDIGRPDRNGLMGDCDCMTLWTIRAAQAAGLEHAVLCAIISEAQGLAEAGKDAAEVEAAMHDAWPGVRFSVEWSGEAWVLSAYWALDFPVPVAFSPRGWER